MKRALIVVSSFLSLGGAASAKEATPLTTSAFGPGEQATYRVQYLGITAGTAQVTVGAEVKQWGKPVWPIVALATSDPLLAIYPVKDKFITYWDASNAITLGNDLFADENNKRRRVRIKLDHDKKNAVVVRQKEGEDEREDGYDIQPGAMDIAAAAFALRTKPLKEGAHFEFPIFTGKKAFTLRAVVEKKETLETAIGKKDAFKIRVQTEFEGKFQSKRDLFVYLSADEQHVPLRLEAEFAIGTLKAELVDYKQGRLVASLAGSTP